MVLECGVMLLVGFVPPISADDINAIKQAPLTCTKLYPDAPCAVELRKKEKLVYNVLCGNKSKTKSEESNPNEGFSNETK